MTAHRTKLGDSSVQTFRLEDANVASVQRLARGDDISKSDWYRRAVLAQLAYELNKEKEASGLADLEDRTVSCAPDPSPAMTRQVLVEDNRWS